MKGDRLCGSGVLQLKDGATGDLSSRAIYGANHLPRHLIRRVKRASGIVPRLRLKGRTFPRFFPPDVRPDGATGEWGWPPSFGCTPSR